MTSPITLARRSVWQAIDSWAALRVDGKSVFATTIRFEDEQAVRLDNVIESLGPGDLPCLAILPRQIGVSWKHTRIHHWILELRILMWTPNWNVLTAEKYTPEIINAAFAAAPTDNPTISFVKNPTTGTGYDPESVPVIQFNTVGVGKNAETKAIETEINLRLMFDFAPFSNP